MRSSFLRLYLLARGCVLWPFVRMRPLERILPGEVRSILVLRHDRIGDMVLTTSLLGDLKRTFPQAKITVFASAANRAVLEGSPDADEVVVDEGGVMRAAFMASRSWDLAVDPFVTYELETARLIAQSRARYRVGFEEAGREIYFNVRGPSPVPKASMVNLLARLAAACGVSAPSSEPRLFLQDAERETALRFLEKSGVGGREIVTIHPGGHYPSQRWPQDRFLEIVGRLGARPNTAVVVFADAATRSFWESVPKEGLWPDRARLMIDADLRQLMALIGLSRLFIGNNSGPLHIACALKVPTVSTLGPTDPVLWAPPAVERHVIIRRDPLECVTVDEVWQAVDRQLKGPRT